MIKKNFAFAFILSVLGWIGVASLLSTEIILPEEITEMLAADFTPFQLKLLMLINPGILVLISVGVGTLLFKRLNLSVPIIERLVGLEKNAVNYKAILKYGFSGGALAGILLFLLISIFTQITPTEFEKLGASLELGLATRFLYGGITEELLMRFGLMTLLAWLFSKLFNELKPAVYWLALIFAALIFAIGHFPAVYNSLGQPSAEMITYVLLGNTIGGLIFGWLYWKKGLESAIIAHSFAHVFILLANHFFL